MYAAASPTITLERTACYGTCPTYSVSVGPDLHVAFIGKEYVQSPGLSTSAISNEDYRRLRDAVRDVLKFRDSYASPHECGRAWATDNPGLVLTVQDSSFTKRIDLNFGCRGEQVRGDVKALGEIGELIDEVLHTQQWIGDARGREGAR
jgi:hypothetical protein